MKRLPKQRALGLAAIAMLLAALLPLGMALAATGWTVTPATGGTNISSTTAGTGGSGAWTTLTGPTITSTSTTADLITPGAKLTLSLPSNFEFNSNINFTPPVTPSGCGLTAGPILYFGAGFTATNASIPVSGTTGQTCSIAFGSALQVRPISSDPSAGTGGAIQVMLDTLDLGSGGTLTMVTPAPTPTPTPTPSPTPPPPGTLTLTTSSPYMNNNAINWGEYVDLTTTSSPATTFALQASTDQSTWTTITNLTTNSSGASKYRYTPIRNYWYRSVVGSKLSNQPRVTVRQTISIKPSSTSTKTVSEGTQVTFSATVRPARPELQKAKVVFQVYQKVSGTWKLTSSVTKTIDDSGIATLTWTFSTPGSWYVRAQAQPTPVNANSFWTPNQYYNVQ